MILYSWQFVDGSSPLNDFGPDSDWATLSPVLPRGLGADLYVGMVTIDDDELARHGQRRKDGSWVVPLHVLDQADVVLLQRPSPAEVRLRARR